MELVWIAILSVFVTAIVLIDNLKKATELKSWRKCLRSTNKKRIPKVENGNGGNAFKFVGKGTFWVVGVWFFNFVSCPRNQRN